MVMHLTAPDWISGTLGVSRKSISLVSPPPLWISRTLSLSHRQLATTGKASA